MQDNRIKKVIGEKNLNKLNNARILLVGIGGVGGITLEMLVRSGVGDITIIDYDTFEESNLNRQILSLESNMGEIKVKAAKRRMLDVAPYCHIKEINAKVNGELLNNLPANFDYVIDACDDVKAKVSLVKYALENNVKIISCCGTGNRINSEKLKISNIWKTEYDPLAKKFRNELRKENVNYKLPVVCSTESPLVKTNGFVGSMAMVPNSAGILLAGYVINDIIDK